MRGRFDQGKTAFPRCRIRRVLFLGSSSFCGSNGQQAVNLRMPRIESRFPECRRLACDGKSSMIHRGTAEEVLSGRVEM
jgi:hypothetical protein